MTMVQFKPLLALIFFSSCLIIKPFTSAKFAEVHYCNKKANYPVKVSGVEINPYPISRGKNTTFSIAASTEEPISGGKLTVDVTYFIFHVYSEYHNLCSETSCLVSAGDFVVSHSQKLPGIAPPGSYKVKMTMVDANKKQLTCITFDLSIAFVAPESLADA